MGPILRQAESIGLRTGAACFITGNPWFPGGLGRTTKPEEFDTLFHDVSTQVFGVYGDNTVVYPGHGDDTTLGEERPRLAEWRARGW